MNLYSDNNGFSDEAYEHHFNTEMWRFWMQLNELAVEEDYPYIRPLLQKTIEEFKKMKKDTEYSIFGIL